MLRSKAKQSGNVLLVSLVILGIVSFATLNLSKGAVSDIKVTAMHADTSMALAEAHVSTYRAERYITDRVTNPHWSKPEVNYYASSSEFDLENFDWDSMNNLSPWADGIAGFVVVYQNTISIPGESVAGGGVARAGSQAEYYTIYSYNKTPLRSKRLLQVTYAKQI